MPIARSKQFPSGFLVAALLAASGLLWAVMFFGPLAHLERLASGLTPFDIRPRGYSYAEALGAARNRPMPSMPKPCRSFRIDPSVLSKGQPHRQLTGAFAMLSVPPRITSRVRYG